MLCYCICVDIEGVVVLFELVNGPASVATLQQQQSGGPGFGLGRENGNGKEKERELLVCETSRELRCYSELFVEPVAVTAEGLPIALHSSGYTSSEQHQLQQGQGQGQGQGQEEGGHPTYRSCHWELFAESWIQNDLDFLEGFIH